MRKTEQTVEEGLANPLRSLTNLLTEALGLVL
jgi:hypothetical protein